MMDRALTRYYDRLKPRERLCLALEASGRGDADEWQRLVETCPRQSMSGPELAFRNPFEATRVAALVFAILWGAARAKVERWRIGWTWRAEAYRQGMVHGWQMAGGSVRRKRTLARAVDAVFRGKPLPDVSPEYRQALAELQGVYAGFVRFCAKIDLPPNTVLGWYAPLRDEVAQAWELQGSTVPTDGACAQDVFRILCKTWPGLEAERGDEMGRPHGESHEAGQDAG